MCNCLMKIMSYNVVGSFLMVRWYFFLVQLKYKHLFCNRKASETLNSHFGPNILPHSCTGRFSLLALKLSERTYHWHPHNRE